MHRYTVVGMDQMHLNVLNVSCNGITHLPADMVSMSSLHTLIVEGNPLAYPPTSVSIPPSYF